MSSKRINAYGLRPDEAASLAATLMVYGGAALLNRRGYPVGYVARAPRVVTERQVSTLLSRSRAIILCARTMRLTHQAQMHPRSAGRASADTVDGPKPWDLEFLSPAHDKRERD